MALTTARNLYSRNDMAALLTAMSMEERQWTLDFLLNLMIVPTEQKVEAKPIVDFRQFCGIIGETGESDKQRIARILHERFDA